MSPAMSVGHGLLDRFSHRVLGVATAHGKERAIGPVMKATLPIAGFTAIKGIDTDRFGAFSGEVQRTQDALEACKAKAMHGAELSGHDLVIASEGSFGPYPPAPFVTCDEEILVIYDARDERFFVHKHVSLETVFGGESCTSWEQAAAFAKRMKFPDHGLVLRAQEKWTPPGVMKKGITDEAKLRDCVNGLIASHGACWIETDMRAMLNPTRMRVIAEAAARFAEQLVSCCSACNACWFRITGTRNGLPCMLCGWPTESIRSIERGCWHCGHVAFAPRPDGKQHEDPQHCGNCNP